jgi:porphobilinogen deaminase
LKPTHCVTDEEKSSLLHRLEKQGVFSTDVRADLSLGRAALLVSSTSWTPDEDFTMLVEGLLMYATEKKNDKRFVFVYWRCI